MITHLTYEGRQPGHPLLDSLLVTPSQNTTATAAAGLSQRIQRHCMIRFAQYFAGLLGASVRNDGMERELIRANTRVLVTKAIADQMKTLIVRQPT